MVDEKILIAFLSSIVGGATLFTLQKLIDWAFHNLKKKGEKDDKTLEGLVTNVAELNVAFATLEVKVDLTLQQIFKIQQVEQDLNALGEKFRSKL